MVAGEEGRRPGQREANWAAEVVALRCDLPLPAGATPSLRLLSSLQHHTPAPLAYAHAPSSPAVQVEEGIPHKIRLRAEV